MFEFYQHAEISLVIPVNIIKIQDDWLLQNRAIFAMGSHATSSRKSTREGRNGMHG